MSITINDIQNAAGLLQGKIQKTPCIYSQTLSNIVGADIFLKFENLQFTASFKERGALVKLLSLTSEQRQKGVIAMSAGNHAQALAYHAQRLKIPAVIVMPIYTPNVKVEHTRGFGAEVILQGENFDTATDAAMILAKERNLVLVHPYDDEEVIAGQGTISLEMLEEFPDLDTMIFPVGGGGLIAGNAIAAKAINPAVKIIGVETKRFPSMFNAIINKPPVFGESTIAEGIAVKRPGELTLPVIRELVDEILLVDEELIEHAVQLFLEIEKTVAEGAGAAGLAALLQNKEKFHRQKIGLVISGGNIDMTVLADVIKRGLVHSGRLQRIRIEMRDVAGALSKVTSCIENNGARITQVHHHRTFIDQPIQTVEVEFVLQTRGREHVQELVSSLQQSGIKVHL